MIGYCATVGNLEKVKELIATYEYFNNDTNPADEGGYTPIYYAAEKGHLEIIKFLANGTANLNSGNIKQVKPIFSKPLKLIFFNL